MTYCGAGYCFTGADLLALLFAAIGGVAAALAELLVLITALRTHRRTLGLGLALLIFTTFAAALVYIATNAFQAVIFAAPGAYFARSHRLP